MARKKAKAKAGTDSNQVSQPSGKRRTAGEVEIWNPIKRGDKLEGTYIDNFHFVGKRFKNEQTLYKVSTADSGVQGLFGSARLDRLMSEIPKGSKVWITFLGRVTQGDNDNVKDWQVEYEAPVPF